MPVLAAAGEVRDRIRVRIPFRVVAGATTLELANIAPESRAKLLAEIERYRHECGCRAGGVGALAGFVSVLGWQLAFITAPFLSLGVGALVEIVAATVISGVIGKLVGLGLARARLRRVITRLLAQHPAPHRYIGGT